MRTPIQAGLIVAIMLATASCGAMISGGTREPAEESFVVVENQSTLQVTVYVLRDSHRQRLGTAESLRSTRLRIPSSIIFGPTNLRFEISPLGSNANPISTEIMVSPGDEITLTVPSTIR